MNMIERVARALWAIQRNGLDKCDMELEDVSDQYDTISMATAAIQAMRDPTPEMIEAGRIVDVMALRGVDRIWQAMIDAAAIDTGVGEG